MIPSLSPRKFVLGGNAIFTLKSLKTGQHFTFKARQPKKDSPVFVSVLTGSNNEEDYTFLGSIFNGFNYAHGRKSRIGSDAPSAIAFDWFWNNVDCLPATCEFHHEGRCACCGRTLTHPESVVLGIGPECAKRVGL